MTTTVDLIVGKTSLAFAEAETLSFEEHHEAFDRLVNLLKKNLQGRHNMSEQSKHFDISS